MYAYFTCPECGERFMVPHDATGALVDCTDCVWSGTCTDVEDATTQPRQLINNE